MSAAHILALIGALALMLITLGWLGWRFFVTLPPPTRMLTVAPAPIAPQRPPRRWSWPGNIGAEIRSVLGHRAIWLGVALAGLSIFGALALAGRFSLDPLQAFSFERQGHINLALNPERLVPPPPLPPALFASVDRPGLEFADRDWAKLEPAFMQAVLQLFARMEARGYALALLEGYRSPERQDMLADLGNNVTNARGLQSRHQFGLAADIAPVKDGRLLISERDPWAFEAYQALGQEAEALGLAWGGRWNLRDYGHVEFTRAGKRG